MTDAEFWVWLQHHKGCFPDLGKYFQTIPNETEVLDRWRAMLRDVRLDDAKAASDQLYEAATRPRSPADHGVAIKRIAGEIKTGRERAATTARFTGQQTYGCRWCRDTGLVEAYVSGERLRYVIEAVGVEAAAKSTSMMRCDCGAGGRKPGNIVLFDPNVHMAHRGSWAWLKSQRPGDYQRRMAEVEAAAIEDPPPRGASEVPTSRP